MKSLAIALMIAAFIVPATAGARDHDRGGQNDGRPAPAYGPRGGAAPAYRGYGGPGAYRPYGSPGYGSPGAAYRGGYPPPPPPRAYGPPASYAPYGRAQRFHHPGDWNDFGPQGGAHARWRRGQLFPPALRGNVVTDYYRYHLRRPPPGYYWYRNGDDFILASLASGLIFEVVSGNGY